MTNSVIGRSSSLHLPDFSLAPASDGGIPDTWTSNGRWRQTPGEGLFYIPPIVEGERGIPNTPVDYILSRLSRGPCEVMVLGPGVGEDIHLAHNFIESKLGDTKKFRGLSIDVFGLTKTLTPAVREITRCDYSGTKDHPTRFESFDNPELRGRYDVVIAQQSVGVHTLDPMGALKKTAKLLCPQGAAYVEIKVKVDPGSGMRSDPTAITDGFTKYWSTKREEFQIKIIEKDLILQNPFDLKDRPKEQPSNHEKNYWVGIKRTR